MLNLVNQFPGLGMTYQVTDCTSSAHQDPARCLPAPAESGQGECTPFGFLLMVSPCGNWRRVDDRAELSISPLWGVINTNAERRA